MIVLIPFILYLATMRINTKYNIILANRFLVCWGYSCGILCGASIVGIVNKLLEEEFASTVEKSSSSLFLSHPVKSNIGFNVSCQDLKSFCGLLSTFSKQYSQLTCNSVSWDKGLQLVALLEAIPIVCGTSDIIDFIIFLVWLSTLILLWNFPSKIHSLKLSVMSFSNGIEQ